MADDKASTSPVECSSVFKALRDYRKVSASLQQLTKSIKILRRKQEENGRKFESSQEKLKNVLHLKLKPRQTKKSQSKNEDTNDAALTLPTSFHIKQSSWTKETAHNLRRHLEEARHNEASHIRLNKSLNQEKLECNRRIEIERKRKKREEIFKFQKGLKERQKQHRQKKLQKSTKAKLEDLERLVWLKQQNEQLLQELARQKESMMTEYNTQQSTFKSYQNSLRRMPLCRGSDLLEAFRKQQLGIV